MADLTLRKKFGKRLRSLRRVRDLTQLQLAERADVSVNAISLIETGKTSPSIETIVSLAKALDVEVAELFRFE